MYFQNKALLCWVTYRDIKIINTNKSSSNWYVDAFNWHWLGRRRGRRVWGVERPHSLWRKVIWDSRSFDPPTPSFASASLPKLSRAELCYVRLWKVTLEVSFHLQWTVGTLMEQCMGASRRPHSSPAVRNWQSGSDAAPAPTSGLLLQQSPETK